MNTALIAALVLGAIACGGGGAKPDPAAEPMNVQKHEVGAHAPAGEHEEHGKMPAAISKFHDTLAPRWHADKGPQRMADTCAALPQLHSDAAAVVAAPAPEGADPAVWSAGGTQLDAAVTALEAPCKANDAAAFEPAFERVHTSFHHVMEAGGGHK